MRTGGANKFVPSNPAVSVGDALQALQPGALGRAGLGGFAPSPMVPAAIPTMPGAVKETPLSQQGADEALRDILDGKGLIRATLSDLFFKKFIPPGVTFVKDTLFSDTTMGSGVNNTISMGGFQVPPNQIFILTYIEFFANRSSGGIDTPILPGQLGRTLTFGLLDNGHAAKVNSFFISAPLGNLAAAPFGIYAPNQAGVQNPSGQVFQAGPGAVFHHDGDCLYFAGKHEVVITATSTTGLPYAVTSQSITLEGVLIDENSLTRRVQT